MLTENILELVTTVNTAHATLIQELMHQQRFRCAECAVIQIPDGPMHVASGESIEGCRLPCTRCYCLWQLATEQPISVFLDFDRLLNEQAQDYDAEEWLRLTH